MKFLEYGGVLYTANEIKVRTAMNMFDGSTYKVTVLINQPRLQVRWTKEYTDFYFRKRKKWWQFWFKEIEPSQNIKDGYFWEPVYDAWPKSFID